MKYIISEYQFSLLNKSGFILEQSDEVFDWKFGIKDKNMKAVGLNPSIPSDRRKYDELTYQIGEWDHDVASTFAFLTLIIPPPFGTTLFSIITAMDASIYLIEGDEYEAGLRLLFSVIPAIGPIAKSFGFVTKLGQKGMTQLAEKIITGQKLTQLERRAIIEIKRNSGSFQKEIVNWLINNIKKGISVFTKNPAIQSIITNAIKSLSRFVYDILYVTIPDVLYSSILEQEVQILVKEAGFDWQDVKSEFMSSGSLEDNEKLYDAWLAKSKWRPTKEVPERFWTYKYKDALRKRNEPKPPLATQDPKETIKKQLGIKSNLGPNQQQIKPIGKTPLAAPKNNGPQVSPK